MKSNIQIKRNYIAAKLYLTKTLRYSFIISMRGFTGGFEHMAGFDRPNQEI